MRRRGGILADLVKGAIAGAVATWALDRTADMIEGRGELGAAVHGFVTGQGSGRPVGERPGTDGSRDGAGEAGARGERQPSPPARRTNPLRWGLGIGAGAIYGVVRPRVPFLSRSERMGFGSSFFVLIDEGLLSGLGFQPPPTSFPWNAETRGLAGHIVFGVVADATLSVLDHIA